MGGAAKFDARRAKKALEFFIERDSQTSKPREREVGKMDRLLRRSLHV